MKLFPKIAFAAIVTGIGGFGATMWGAPASDIAALGRASTMHATMLDDFRETQHSQALARRDRDVVKLNCVNDKLVQMKAELNVADHALSQLQAAGDPSEQTAAMAGLTESASNVHDLRNAAEGCIGAKILSSESANAYTHPDILDNPTQTVYEQTIEPPIYASPFN